MPIAALEAEWPDCRVRRILPPFASVGVAFAPDDAPGEDEPPDSDTGADDTQQRLVAWSLHHPGQPLAFVAADCFGGTCLYAGFTCLDGHVLDIVPLTRRGEGGLRRLLQPLGIELVADEDFPPLQRGYFDA